MRLKKEAQSQSIKKDIDRTFDRFIWVNVAFSGLACLALPFLLGLRTSGTAASASARRAFGQGRLLAAQ